MVSTVSSKPIPSADSPTDPGRPAAYKHTNNNMPMLVAGGRLKHGQHLAFDRDNNHLLPNLFVSMLQSMGSEADRFATSTGTMKGLDWA